MNYYRFWIDYEFTDPYKWFQIGGTSGQVTVRNTLDRELLASTNYQTEVRILAIDEGTGFIHSHIHSTSFLSFEFKLHSR